MNNYYYVLRLGSVFRIIYMDDSAVEAWKHGGWELQAHDTNAQAQVALEKWKARIAPRPVISLATSNPTVQQPHPDDVARAQCLQRRG
jgi:hypothetical protein